MHTPFLVGLLLAFALTALGLATFYFRIWWRRRDERSFLHFGLFTFSAALYCGIEGLLFLGAYGHWEASQVGLVARLLLLPATACPALLLHFALHYANLERAERIMRPIYAGAAAFAALGLAGGWWRTVPERFAVVERFGLSLHALALRPTWVATPFYVGVVLVVAVVIVLMGKGLRGRAWGHAAFVGAVVLGVVALNELALGLGMSATVPLAPFGFVALGFGVALTLVSRYGDTARAIEARSTELRERSRQLDASYQDLLVAQQSLVKSEQLALVGELAAVIAHEVRNPLAVVGNAVASLRKRQTTRTERLVLLEIIDEEMTRLDKLVWRLLNYARPVVPKREAVDLEALVERSLAVLEIEGSSIEIDVGAGVDSTVEGDPDLLRQAFENVLTNAAQATRAGGTIQVTVEETSTGVSIAFRDDGEGMGEEALAQAVSPFFTTRPTGTGLGLPIVRRIAEAHGGHVELRSTLGQGTTVTLSLPRKAPLEPPPSQREPLRSLSVLP